MPSGDGRRMSGSGIPHGGYDSKRWCFRLTHCRNARRSSLLKLSVFGFALLRGPDLGA
jgi:hypothetical protein